jgi:triphosphoribosyl-dephospho-CoA synthase
VNPGQPNIDSIATHCQLACIWEATARKPGNVHRFQDFPDVTYLDFISSAAAIAPVLGNARQLKVGEIVLRAVEQTRAVAPTNTNLGLILLLAPLAKAACQGDLRQHLTSVLAACDIADADHVYRAIRLAAPGGLDTVAEQDVHAPPTQALCQVMALAADRDLVARQYSHGFHEVLQDGVPALQRGLDEMGELEGAIIACHLQLLRRYPDSLIARKCGPEIAKEASRRAALVIDAGWPRPAGCTAMEDLDRWLRADGHRRNPGTTADLVGACLFVALREGIITLPPQLPWCRKPALQ